MRARCAPLAIAAALAALAAQGCGGGGVDLEAGPAVAGFALGGLPATLDPRFTCDGEDVSPALSWSGVPEGALELALLVEDPDADGFVHWVAYGISPEASSLPEGVAKEPSVASPVRLVQGENGFGRVGWGGPCPPEGERHRYVFRLLALDRPLELEPGAGAGELVDAVSGHVLGEARAETAYERR